MKPGDFFLALVAALVILLGTSGCATGYVTSKALGQYPVSYSGNPAPAYWLLLPPALVVDLVTSPIQIFWLAAYVDNN